MAKSFDENFGVCIDEVRNETIYGMEEGFKHKPYVTGILYDSSGDTIFSYKK